MTGAPRGYEAIKAIAKQTGVIIPGLLALARQNDPFFAGSPAQRIKAEWFTSIFRQFDYSGAVHLRRIHYQLLSQRDPRRHDGLPYENTESCWDYLCDGAKIARHLGLVDPRAFQDHRNGAPRIFASDARETPDPGFSIEEPDFWALPHIDVNIANTIHLPLPRAAVEGYDYDQADQPYHLEIWIEKSTMDDVLLPICRQHTVNLVTGVGFQSITSAILMLARTAQAGKPVRVFYISDFDPAGDSMPVAVARHLEYHLPEHAPGSDVKLTPLALTREQAISYQLPRTPVKDSDKRKAGWEQRQGEGATELDALEALFPGSLGAIVRAAVAPYRDSSLQERLWAAEERAEGQLRQAWDAAAEPYRQELDAIEAAAASITRRYQDRLLDLNNALQQELAPFRDQLSAVRLAIQQEAEQITVALPARPTPRITPPDENHWLFDSQRSYMEQLAVYKARKAHANDGDGGAA